ncbi:hypothetical protein C2I18_14470 [Paenibacillus sp. PK3_47]|uniref:hypothetical protein n=1 Tax=Paenibacillus sp. PK3_47 TaxID=2072642 RepID=UPI00201DBFAA|nr:hypothetical protein [Paenibacillus sp. PK3_47]UQZ34623.1 hypothetical protein C2I18_14470 [Paenibacillus sp. PK3_47]
MNHIHKVLESDTDFLAAVLSQVKVSVWYRADPDPNGHLMNYGGIVEKYTPESVKLSGSYFVRSRFEFRA